LIVKQIACRSLLLVTLFFLCVVHALAENESDKLVESKALKAELQQLVAETLKAAREAGEPVPAEMTAEKMIARFIPEIRKHDPTFLRVRPDIEKNYEQGEFDDAAARARWKSAVNTLADFNVKLPKLHERLLSADEARPLRGARLELAAQLFEAQVAHLVRELMEAR
jgi:hypothetical protein